MLTGRALLGLTEALFVPLAISLIGTALPPALRARAVGLFFTAQLCGVVAGGSLGGWIAEHWGWRLSFFALGTAGAIFAAPLLLFFRNFQEPKIVERPSSIKTSAFGELAKSSMYVSLCFGFPASLMIVTILYGWLPNFLHEKFSLDRDKLDSWPLRISRRARRSVCWAGVSSPIAYTGIARRRASGYWQRPCCSERPGST